jgi:hypothetical protein
MSVSPLAACSAATVSKLTSGLAAAFGASVIIVALSPAVASASAVFTCKALPTQTCYFATVSGDAVKQRFTLKSGAQSVVESVDPTGDSYMVSINFAPPQRPERCLTQPVSGAKRSAWCKLSRVHAGPND